MTTMMRTLLVRVAACVLGVMAMVATAHASDGSSTAEADNNAGGIPDVWEMDGARFDLAALKLEVFAAPIASVGGSSLRLKLGGGLPCKTMAGQPAHQRHFSDDSATAACMLVPGVPPNVAASTAGARISLLDAGNPGIGFVVSLQGGDHCEVVKRGRKLDARFLCDPTGARRSVTAWEGQGMNVCHYVMEIRTQQACPAHTTSARPVEPLLSGVSGCASDTDTSTSGCKQGMTLVVHGRGFQHNVAAADVLIGDATCLNTRIMSNWQLTCTLPDVPSLHPTLEVRLHHADGEPTVLRVENAVTYAPSPQRLHHQFQTFEDLGVGGLNKEISEIYRRVFQSRALPSNIVSALGIKHIKGILLYGPPGSGKTLVAR
ncbi:hypothetical protein PTSG_09792 [Salpingoeca rosetta]|uniref:Vesicle-fusing ATPase n=1 Tax=Salpingoeca rosetta (strain ATCC 50818 / BSB-021) TaxID=946362 RepID=F2UP27_SALR5|nr:uncharacterized protein PTSG_09792 [Salpingoeca rosetta]EGD79382.1 hypothetical protein PTSG_09792 [Salpingoeca rosetta]|eukprot:XP_004989151.1 hypothetical protein PTSG_09792 [Salpingoeca rosetta]